MAIVVQKNSSSQHHVRWVIELRSVYQDLVRAIIARSRCFYAKYITDTDLLSTTLDDYNIKKSFYLRAGVVRKISMNLTTHKIDILLQLNSMRCRENVWNANYRNQRLT